MKKYTFILCSLCLIVIISLCLLKKLNLNIDFNLYNENHSVQKGETSLYEYYEKNYYFSDVEKRMISNRFKLFDIFNNNIFQVLDYGDLRITFAIKDYDADGIIYLYSYSSFDTIKRWFEDYGQSENITIGNTWIYIFDELGEIRFYKNSEDSTFRIIYITKLPYRYMIDETNTYPPFVQYFLDINLKNLSQYNE